MLPFINYDELFEYFCHQKDYENACKLIDLFPFDLKKTLHSCCVYGHRDVVYHIVTLYPHIRLYPHTFEETCLRNEIEVAECLFQYKQKYLSSRRIILNIIYRICTETNYINMLEWLSNVIHSVQLNDFFYPSCYNPISLEIAKYIFQQTPIDLMARDHFLFHSAIRKQLIPLAQWIVSLRPDIYSITIHKNKINSYHIEKYYTLIYCSGVAYTQYDETCSICYESANVISHCHHTFCDSCLYQWYKRSCPYCRQHVQFYLHLEQV